MIINERIGAFSFSSSYYSCSRWLSGISDLVVWLVVESAPTYRTESSS